MLSKAGITNWKLAQKIEYEVEWNPRKIKQTKKAVRLNQVTNTKQTEGTNKKVGIVTEVQQKGKYGFIMPIIMDQRVFVHRTHIKCQMQNTLLVGRNVEYIVET